MAAQDDEKRLEKQAVVLTVPASFDDVARNLTVEAARQAGAHLLIFNHHAFSMDRIDEALDQLEDADLTREEKRNYELRLKQLQPYEGFTCSVELSFTLEGTLYSFESHTDWYESFTDTVNELETFVEDQDVEEDDSLGGYFSKN